MTDAQKATLAGDCFVAHKIAMLGLLPLFVRQSLPGIDLLVCAADWRHAIGVQVKASFDAARESEMPAGAQFSLCFPLGQRSLAEADAASLFCFVDLHLRVPNQTPDVYVVRAAALQQEYAGVAHRRYAEMFHVRPWESLQPYRNNWSPLLDLFGLKSPPRVPRVRHDVTRRRASLNKSLPRQP